MTVLGVYGVWIKWQARTDHDIYLILRELYHKSNQIPLCVCVCVGGGMSVCERDSVCEGVWRWVCVCGVYYVMFSSTHTHTHTHTLEQHEFGAQDTLHCIYFLVCLCLCVVPVFHDRGGDRSICRRVPGHPAPREPPHDHARLPLCLILPPWSSYGDAGTWLFRRYHCSNGFNVILHGRVYRPSGDLRKRNSTGALCLMHPCHCVHTHLSIVGSQY